MSKEKEFEDGECKAYTHIPNPMYHRHQYDTVYNTLCKMIIDHPTNHIPKIPAVAPATRALPLCFGLFTGAMI